ncbi:hypothetical protein HY641_02085 [Candidatus Woesearchaeota archaeon]|nr:hypothetical protein [Candidatus Woesearchaeota archaeon]
MDPVEIAFWSVLYWALYLPSSIALQIATGEGSILGVLLIGTFFTAMLLIILVFQDDILLDMWNPVLMAKPSVPSSSQVEPSPKKKVAKRGRPPKKKAPTEGEQKGVIDAEKNKQMEVSTNVKKEEANNDPADAPDLMVGMEPEPKMRTDVDLGQLDADDDDLLS